MALTRSKDGQPGQPHLAFKVQRLQVAIVPLRGPILFLASGAELLQWEFGGVVFSYLLLPIKLSPGRLGLLSGRMVFGRHNLLNKVPAALSNGGGLAAGSV